jgi:hypothetical protein
VRWHCLALLRSLHRDDAAAAQRRVAELLWRYVQAMEHRPAAPPTRSWPSSSTSSAGSRWPSSNRQRRPRLRRCPAPGGEAPASALLRLGGLTSAIEMPLASEQELLAYARGLDALAGGNDRLRHRPGAGHGRQLPGDPRDVCC